MIRRSGPCAATSALEGSQNGRIAFFAGEAIALPFHTVDCRAGCGTPGWYELHTIVWNQARQEVGFEIIYLNEDGSVSTFNGIQFSRRHPNCYRSFPGGDMVPLPMKGASRRGSPITFVMRPCLFLTLALGMLAFAAAACRQGRRTAEEARGGESSPVVAKVGDAVITVADLQKRIDKLPPFARARRAYAEAQALPKGPANLEEQQERFRELVARDSDDRESQSRAGELLSFSDDSILVPRPIVDAAFKLKMVGDLAPPIKTDHGWAVILLTQKRPGINHSLPEVKRQIQQRLFRDLHAKAVAAFVADVRKKSNITINDANLSKVVVEAGTGPTAAYSLPGALGPPINAPALAPAPAAAPKMEGERGARP